MTVSVRRLCAFGAKAGDLDLRFVPAPSAQQGMAGHALVQSRRGPTYQSEVALSSRFRDLQVRGRADGYDAVRGRVEEIKTFRGDFDAIRPNHRALHWAQARTYGWMLCEQHGLVELDVALVYLDVATAEETVLEERWTRAALRDAFEALCERFADWARHEGVRKTALSRELQRLAFPHAAFRAGQRELAQAVFRASASGRCLIAQAPTGIGKTLATLFPLLKGWTKQRTDKIFFLTAKTPGRAIALDALRVLRGNATEGTAALRVLELTAREKICEYPGRACHGDDCPRARGFYDRLPAARNEAVRVGWLDRERLREVASTHEVCPYFLAQELTHWCDVIVADYNYYFDGSAFLFALTMDEAWTVSVLVDEAHNLVERARGMYSARLDAASLDTARRLAPGVVKRALSGLTREWRSLQSMQQVDYVTRDEVPERFHRVLQDTVSVMAEHFTASPKDAYGPLQQFFFDVLQFARLSDAFGDHSVFESTLGAEGEEALSIRNIVPAPFLRPRFAATASSTCFSGTMSPFAFYRDVLGLPQDTAHVDVCSPFEARQLQVRVAMDVSTRFRDRTQSLGRVSQLMARQFKSRPGNYLAFFSSFDYLDSALALFSSQHPEIAVWAQSRGMREGEREAFVTRFAEDSQGIGFAVLGGAFGEGIDLPGDRLIGAFVASLGLPQHNEMNEVTRERMEARFGDGYGYTYLYPGLRKVVQAAGRVIRTENDSGVLFLLDDRFARPEVRELLPTWWKLEEAYGAGEGNRTLV